MDILAETGSPRRPATYFSFFGMHCPLLKGVCEVAVLGAQHCVSLSRLNALRVVWQLFVTLLCRFARAIACLRSTHSFHWYLQGTWYVKVKCCPEISCNRRTGHACTM